MKEIWCTRQLLVSFRLEFLNCRTQKVLSWFEDFEHKCCVYWIVYLTTWSLEGFSLISNWLLLICLIEIGGVELLVVEKKNNDGDIWFIQGLGFRRKTTKVKDTLGTPIYRFLCDTLRRRSIAHFNRLFHFV